MIRKLFAWIFALISLGIGGALFLGFISMNTHDQWRYVGGLSGWLGQVVPQILVGLLSAVTAFFLYRSSRPEIDETEQQAEDSSGLTASNEPFGSAFDVGTLHRSKVDVYRDRPETLRARVRDIRNWEEKVGWSRLKTESFHLDYDRSPKDFGDLILVLRPKYFKKFNYREGDNVEVHLRWARSGEKNAIASIWNLDSGQKYEPDSISDKAGHLRAQ